LQWQFFLPVWNSHCTRVRFTVIVSCSDELAIHSCLFLCLQRRLVKVASGLFCCWSLLRNNTVATNPQRFTLYCGSRRFVACDYWTGLPGWPFWGQISEIWSQTTLAGPKISFGPLAIFWPFSRIDWPLARIRSDHPGSCLRNHIF